MLDRMCRKGNPPTPLVGMLTDNHHYGKDYGDSLKKKKLEINLPYDPETPLLGIYLENTAILKDTCAPVFTAAILTIVRTWK